MPMFAQIKWILAATILASFLSTGKCHAQIPSALENDPKQLVISLVFALQVGDQLTLYRWFGTDLLNSTLARTSGTGKDDKLVGLGPVLEVKIEGVESTKQTTRTTGPLQQIITSFKAQVTHQKGTVSWQFEIDDATKRFRTATFDLLPVTAGPIPNPNTSQTIDPNSAPFKQLTPEFVPFKIPPSIDVLQDTADVLTGLELAKGGPPVGAGQHAKKAASPAHYGHRAARPGGNTTDNTPANAASDIVPNPAASDAAKPDGKTPSLVPLAATAPFDSRVVDFLFATTRKQGPSSNSNVTFTADRNPEVTLGAASIRIPEDHKIGRIELPTVWDKLGLTIFEASTKEQKNFTIRKVTTLTPDQWDGIIKAKAPKTALIFVHGFDNTFEDALFRTAQIVWDLQYPGLAVLFSWASAGDLGGYVYDLNSAELARPAFIALLQSLKEKYAIEKVQIIAHSMGNKLVLDALSSYSETSNPDKVAQLIMAAPDVDRDNFIQMIPKVQRITQGMTLYASSADKALAASRIPAKVPRAGDVPKEGPVILPNLETIDVTAVGNEIFGLDHSVFATNRDIIDDIKLVLAIGLHPPNDRLTEIRPVPDPPAAATYWRYVP
jgi:esterase/lipase superfamily enzyme